MALEDTATTAGDQPTASTAGDGDTASAERPAEQTAAQGQSDEGAKEPESEEVRAELERAGEVLAKLPKPLQKEYQKALTQAFQRASEKGKRYEPYNQLLSSLEKDPRGTIENLARQAGLIQAPPPAKDQVDEVLSELASIVGEDEARRLAPAFEKLAEKVIESKIQPLKQHQEYVSHQLAAEQTTAVMKAFEAKHPGWEKHEAKMMEIAETLSPNGIYEGDYLETLYKLATYDLKSAEETKRIAEKMGQSVAASEQVATGVNANRVSASPPKFKDEREAFRAAAEAAKRGEIW